MVLEKEILPFLVWLLPRVDSDGVLQPGGLLLFFIVAAGLLVASVFIAYLRMIIVQGPGEGFYAVAKSIATAITKDFPNTTCRRIAAIAKLAILESLRRRVLIVFFIFALLLLFAGWFLDPSSDHPARLYISFVLTATERLVLVMAILLSAFSLPNDIKNRTIYTVVTKPVRATEIVLGRAVGFCAVNSVLLILMGVISYGFVVRGLNHSHTIDPDDMEAMLVDGGSSGAMTGVTSRDSRHRHEVTVGADGFGRTERTMEHDHQVWVEGEGENRRYRVGPPEGALVARVPIYGRLSFLDRTGRPGKGISVGKEWTYRQYIEGGSLASGVWMFQGITADQFPDYIPLEMNLSVFRTYKGDIVSPVAGTITVKNPTTGLSSEALPFGAREFVTYTHAIPRSLKAVTKEGTLQDVDLFQDLVDQQGQMEIWIGCSEGAQYFGMAQPDVYIRGREGSFAWNFTKAYLGIWLQMIIITFFGVMFSTFLTGSVAMFATAIVYTIGLFKEFVLNLVTGELPGGGPLESLLRIVFQKNVSIELDMGPLIDRAVPAFDNVLLFFLWIGARVFPDFTAFNTSRFVAYGFNINGHLLAQHFVVTVAFVIGLSVYGYFFLKTREVAA
jgi:hypothetical protein